MNFFTRFQNLAQDKNSLLCVGIDPAESGQRATACLPAGADKLQWCLELVRQTGPYASAIKINRNYVKDFSRSEMQRLTGAIRDENCLSIDDSKIADIGSTNHAALYHAKQEGYDAVTYAPFPGNIAETAAYARELDIGLIMLVLMSNPEFQLMKEARFGESYGFEYLARQIVQHQIEGLVLGAPSPKNHISAEEVARVAQLSGPHTMALVPGIGAQGGEFQSILKQFGRRALFNATRSICFANDPGAAAKNLRDQINETAASIASQTTSN